MVLNGLQIVRFGLRMEIQEFSVQVSRFERHHLPSFFESVDLAGDKARGTQDATRGTRCLR